MVIIIKHTVVVLAGKAAEEDGMTVSQSSSKPSLAMENKETHVGVHHPPARLALILDLIVRPQMPITIPLAAPKWVAIAGIGWSNPPRLVCAPLGRDPSIFHLNVLPRWAMDASGSCVDSRSGWVIWGSAVGHVVGGCCRCRTRRIDVRLIAVARRDVVGSPLMQRIYVSKWVHGAMQAVAIAATIGGIRIGVGRRVVRTDIVHCRIVASASVASIAAIAAWQHASGVGAVWLLSGIAEEAALAVAGCVDVLVARLGEGLHGDS